MSACPQQKPFGTVNLLSEAVSPSGFSAVLKKISTRSLRPLQFRSLVWSFSRFWESSNIQPCGVVTGMSNVMIVVMISELHTYGEAYQTGHLNKSALKPSKVRFAFVSWLDPFLPSNFRVRGGRINNPRSHSQARPAGLRGASSKQRPKAIVAPVGTENWVVFVESELKWPKKKQHLQKWGWGRWLEEGIKSINFSAKVTYVSNLNNQICFLRNVHLKDNLIPLRSSWVSVCVHYREA